MKLRNTCAWLLLGGATCLAITAAAQPPGRGGGDRQPDGQGGRPGFGRPPVGQVLPPFLRDSLELTDEQLDELNQLQREVDDRLADILTEEQREQLEQMPGPGGPGGLGPPGGGGPGGGFGPPGGQGGPGGFGPPGGEGGPGGQGGPPQGGPGGFGPPPGGGPGGRPPGQGRPQGDRPEAEPPV